ncbi:MAG: hypothetical protein V4857_27605 [Pseudomonadota bacterium]
MHIDPTTANRFTFLDSEHDSEHEAQGELLPGRDLFTVAGYFEPTQALIVQGCLVAAGIPAVVADANLVQAHFLWANALGGVRIRVPQCHVQESLQIIAAFERGEFALDDDADTGPAEKT